MCKLAMFQSLLRNFQKLKNLHVVNVHQISGLSSENIKLRLPMFIMLSLTLSNHLQN